MEMEEPMFYIWQGNIIERLQVKRFSSTEVVN